MPPPVSARRAPNASAQVLRRRGIRFRTRPRTVVRSASVLDAWLMSVSLAAHRIFLPPAHSDGANTHEMWTNRGSSASTIPAQSRGRIQIVRLERFDRLHVKLFLVIAGAIAGLTLVTYLVFTWAFEAGFVQYLNRADEARLKPIDTGGTVVGYLGYVPRVELVQSLERVYLRRQHQAFAAVAIGMVVAAL